ncbi:hypothetical protein HZB60_04685 [candidate division KSB1 bacterium]|nr:hypothetical protein [candidate division KSB1 bacterium]
MKRRMIYLAMAALVLVAGLVILLTTMQSMQRFDPQAVTRKRDRLVKHNAQFLGRDKVAARYKLDLTGERGLTCFAHYRVPVSDGKLPALLLLYSNPGPADFPAVLGQVERANELAILALNVDSCFGGATRDERSVYNAAQLCLQYLDEHFTIDTNRVFLGGWDRGSLFALPVASLEADEVAGAILHLPLEITASRGLSAAARWGTQSVRERLLVVTPGSAADGALANWVQTAGNLPVCDKRRATSAMPVAMLTESVDWLLGPRADSTVAPAAAPPAPPSLEAIKAQTLRMKPE